MKLIKSILFAAALLLSFSHGVNAALITTGLNCNLTVTNQAYTACSGAYSGNVDNQLADINPFILSQYGVSGTFYSSEDFATSGNPFANHPTGLTSGTLSFDSSLSGDIIVFLKAANAFSIFFFDDVVGMFTLDFNTAGVSVNGNGALQGLSHAGLIMVPAREPPTGNLVPEPSGLALLAIGIFFLLRSQIKTR